MSTYVWCEYASDCNDFRSASTCDSSDDGAEIISAVILSIVSTIRVLQQYTSEAETRTQDQVQRSNAQTVTLKTNVSAEPLAIEDPSAGGWTGYSQQIRYAIAPTRAYHDVTPAPDWS